MTLALAFDIAARDAASPVFAKVGDSAAKAGKSVEQAAAAMQRAANAEVEAAGRVRVAQARIDDLRKSGKASTASLAKAEEQLASAQRLQVRSQGDAVRAASDHEKALKSLSDETSRASRAGKAFGGAFSGGIKLGIGAVIGAVGLLKGLDLGHDLIKSSIAEARESQQVGAKTTAIIKATGGAAKISADQIGALTTAISNKTGVDDEAIQSGSNLLLTFKNVRNEAGKGSDIFNRATAAAVDLSKAGFGSIDSASKSLGKALNDPLKGISALSRAGVTFTAQQKDQIAALVKTGDVLGAQKIILKEVEGQVGGVAAASTTAGEKLKVAFDNAKESIGTAFLPVLDKAENGLRTKLLPAITNGIVPALPKIADGLSSAIGVVSSFGRIGAGAMKPFIKALAGGKDASGSLVNFFESHQAGITDFFVQAGHAAIGLGKALAASAAVGLRAYAGLQKGIQLGLEGTLASIQTVVTGAATAASALGLKDQAAGLEKVAAGLQKLRENNRASNSGDIASSIADNISGKLLPALDAADAGLTKVGQAEIGKAKLRDQAARVAQAIDAIGTNADGSQIKLKKFSDVSKLSASAQKGLRDRISSARDALRGQIEAAQEAGAGQRKLTKTWQDGRDKLAAEFRQMGLSRDAAQKLADEYAGIKPKVKTTFSTPGLSSANSQAGNLKNTLDNMPRLVKIRIQQQVTKGNQALANSDKNVSATGGVWLSGPTGGRIVRAAAGAVLPGWSPGADIHQFYSPTAGRLDLSGGEAIMRPEFTRAVGGVAGVGRLNRAAQSGKLSDWMPRTTIKPQQALPASAAAGPQSISTVVNRGPIQHVEHMHIGNNVDMDLVLRQAEFRDRAGSFG